MSTPATLKNRIADLESGVGRRIVTWLDFMKAMEDGSIEYRPLAPALRAIVDECRVWDGEAEEAGEGEA